MADAAALLVGREYRGQARTVRADQAETRLLFSVLQEDARRRGILVPRFWWRRDAEAGLRAWSALYPSNVTTLGQLADAGVIEVFEGHGSPPGNARATGDIPYVKVTDLKNWRINENPTNFVHHAVANKLRRNGVVLRYGDLVTPARASSNIGQFSLVLPWQTNILLTKEVLILRVVEGEDFALTPFLLLALLSLKVVQDQYKTLALMQTNREHLGDHWREVEIPFPSDVLTREKIAGAVENYFVGIVKARVSWDDLSSEIDPRHFGTRP